MLWRAGLPLNPLDTDPPDRYGIPQAAGRFPTVGHLPALAWALPELCSWVKERYGSPAWVDRGFGSHVLQVSGDDAVHVLKNKDTDSSAMHDVASVFLGRSMIVLDGADHRRARGATGHAFSPAGLDRARVGQLIAEVAQQRVASWPSRDTLPIAREARELALTIICRIIGIGDADIPAWRHQFEELSLSAINIPFDFPGSPMRRGRIAKRWLDERLSAIIERARRKDDHDSVVGAMAHGRDENAQGLTEQELIDNLRLLVLAGHETTASVVAWAMLLLAERPRLWQRLCDEATALDSIPTGADSLAEAPFAEAVFRETLRLYPPVSNTVRTTTRAFSVNGFDIPVGVYIGCNIHDLSRDPARYPEPDAFRPERWLELGRRPTQIELIQFGGGPHFCLGYHVAMLEGVAVLVAAARALSRQGKRPAPNGALPRPVHLPVLHPPRKTSVLIR
jgi:cytochrome P450